MIVPLSVSDSLDRAVTVYGERTGVVDEPDQPAPSWGTITYAEVGQRARRIAAKLDELGIGFGERVAMVSHNSARLLTAFWGVSGHGRVLVPVNFRLSRDEVAYIVEHSGASVLLVDPELDEALADVTAQHRYVLGKASDEVLVRTDVAPTPWCCATSPGGSGSMGPTCRWCRWAGSPTSPSTCARTPAGRRSS